MVGWLSVASEFSEGFAMNNQRRAFLRGVSVTAASPLLALESTVAAAQPAVKALAFDAFPIFDPREISNLAGEMRGKAGKDLASQWAAKLFSYSWLTTSADQYEDFHSLSKCTLRFISSSMNLALTDAEERALIASYYEMPIWPDVVDGLTTLRNNNIRLRLLSNLGSEALISNLSRNKISTLFEAPLSTDRVRRFKPSPSAYAMAIDAFALPRDQIGFVAFAGWDAIGATWFGYRTAWVNRFGLPAEPIGTSPEIMTRGIDGALLLAGLT